MSRWITIHIERVNHINRIQSVEPLIPVSLVATATASLCFVYLLYGEQRLLRLLYILASLITSSLFRCYLSYTYYPVVLVSRAYPTGKGTVQRAKGVRQYTAETAEIRLR